MRTRELTDHECAWLERLARDAPAPKMSDRMATELPCRPPGPLPPLRRPDPHQPQAMEVIARTREGDSMKTLACPGCGRKIDLGRRRPWKSWPGGDRPGACFGPQAHLDWRTSSCSLPPRLHAPPTLALHQG
jgi:hypothetical protein